MAAASLASDRLFTQLGYLLVWGGFASSRPRSSGALQSARLLSPMMATTSRWLGAGILIAAGAVAAHADQDASACATAARR